MNNLLHKEKSGPKWDLDHILAKSSDFYEENWENQLFNTVTTKMLQIGYNLVLY